MLMGVALRLRLLSFLRANQPPDGWVMESMCRISFSKKVFILFLLE
jgi:hypothetical protein